MFEIEYKGGNSLIITTKKSTLVVDPKLSVLGLKDIDVKKSIELATEERLAAAEKDARLLIDGPGEYEVGGFSIRGVSATRHIDTEKDEPIATIYRIEVGDARIALLGNVAENLNDTQLEALGVVDMLLLPVGGGGLTLDPTAAAHLVRQIDPKVVIPLHYKDDALKYEMPQEDVETFIKELGAPVEKTQKYKVKSSLAFPASLTVVVVERT